VSNDDAIALLANLTLVVDLLNDPDFNHARGDDAVGDAIDEVITRHITQQYARHRAHYNLPPVQPDDPEETVKLAIRQDVAKSPDGRGKSQTISAEDDHLLAWSWLYHHFVRVQLNISAPMFAGITGLSERHLRRCREKAKIYLVRSLRSAENHALRKNRRATLLMNLPWTVAERLYGREQQFAQATKLLVNEHLQPILVAGPTGSGKTAFVNELARRLIEPEMRIEGLAWVYEPKTLDELYANLARMLIPHASPQHQSLDAALRATLLQRNVLIVIDSIDSLANVPDAIDQLLPTLSAARLCLTTQQRALPQSQLVRIFMNELTEADIEALIADMHIVAPDARRELARQLRREFGGNPYAIRLMLNNYTESPDASQLEPEEILHRVFERTLQRLDDAAQRLWCACALIPPEGMTLAELRRIWPNAAVQRLDLLRSEMLLRQEDDRLALAAPAQNYVRALVEVAGSPFQIMVADLVAALVEAANRGEPAAFRVIEYAIHIEWPPLPPEVLGRWFRSALHEGQGYSERTFDAMLTLHQAQMLTEPAGLLAFGVGLRRRGQWQQAEQILMLGVTAAGNQGEFDLHPDMFLELGCLLAQGGRYQFARQMFDDAQQMAKRYRRHEVIQAVALERAQMLVDQRIGDQALAQLASVPDNWRSLALQAESHLLLGHPDYSLELALRAVRLLRRDVFNLCRIQVLIGRAYLALGNARLAEAYLQAALTAFDAQGDVYARARAQTNLALLYLRQEKVNSAEALLEEAKITQLALGDDAGLVITQHNLDELNRHKN
jgi:tetratricopeptide (TPR) repeat protein